MGVFLPLNGYHEKFQGHKLVEYCAIRCMPIRHINSEDGVVLERRICNIGFPDMLSRLVPS